MSDIEELQKIADEWVELFMAHDADGCTNTFLADAAIYHPYGPAAEGLEAVRAAHIDWLEDGETNKKLTVVDGRISGDLAYYIGRYSGDYPNDDGSTYTESGVVVAVYHRDADGKWRCRVSALNSDNPPLAGNE